MIRHTVVFTLRHAHGSLQEKAFLRDQPPEKLHSRKLRSFAETAFQ